MWGRSLTREESPIVATSNGANCVLKSNKLGTLEVGKLADTDVLDKDYIAIPEDTMAIPGFRVPTTAFSLGA